jgi:hypothetical protein
VVNVSNMERGMAVTRTNHYHFHCFFFYDRELIFVMCCKNVLIDAFVLDEVIRIVTEIAISP